MGCLSGLAWAQDQSVRQFDIPAGSLAPALNRFADETSLQLVYDTKLADGRTTAGISGSYTVDQALKLLLVGTGLDYRFANDRTVTLQQAEGSAVIVPPVVATEGTSSGAGMSSQTGQKPVKVPEILVKEVRERDNDTKSYVAEEASTATRTDTPVRDIPQSIQVVTRKIIEEQRAFRLQEALQNVSGITPSFPVTQQFDNIIIRGFQANNNNFFRNGLFDQFNAQSGSDTYNIQRLEVLKGPSAVLYGLGDPGGIINIVTSKPLPDPAYAGNVTLGNFNFYRSEIHGTGPLNADRTLLWRLDVAGQKANSFVDFANRDLMAFAPSITWLMSHKTTLTVQAEYIKRWYNNLAALGVPVEGSVRPNINGEIPRNRFTGFGDFDKNNRTTYRAGYDLTHQFNNNWSVRNAYQYSILESDQIAGFGLALLADQRTLTRGVGTGVESSLNRQHLHSMVTNLVGHFKLLETDHTLLTGVELRQVRQNPVQITNRRSPASDPSLLNLDLFAPSYGVNPLSAPVTTNNLFAGDLKLVGVYIQDQIALLSNLKFIGGVRFDYVYQSSTSGAVASNPSEQTSDSTGVSPRLGLVYQPVEPVSLYTTWMRGYLPNSPGNFNPGGKLFDPERSTLYEIGMKTFFFQNRLSTNLAWFHLTRENLLTPDPFIPGFQVQTGEQRSQGIEFDVTASLAAGWNIIASYAYTDAEVTADNNPTLINKRLALVPYNKATLWSTYHFQEGVLKGFGLGGGVYGYTSRNASIFGPGQVEIPGYVRADAALYYNHDLQVGNWLGAKEVNIALNFRNLLDQRYVEAAGNTTTLFYFAEPRTVLATVGLRF
ncbi:TonB-dependent receptor [Nitrospira sp. KM1]|uniref:TonB-dependent siderophore receptor n=1 Tax=Nitrospira sp. KM1 TaxID=1936990 RepID=UPI001563CBC7|nr:TonB-dependent receptor [Nitrospira sp. KM1]